MSGNTITKYQKDHLMDRAIRRHFEEDIKGEEQKKKHKVEKFFCKQVMESKDQRCSKFGNLMSLLLRAKASVEDFLRKEKCEEIPDVYRWNH